MMILPAGVITLAGLTMHDYLGEKVLSASANPLILPKKTLTPPQSSRTLVPSQDVTLPAYLPSSRATGMPPKFC